MKKTIKTSKKRIKSSPELRKTLSFSDLKCPSQTTPLQPLIICNDVSPSATRPIDIEPSNTSSSETVVSWLLSLKQDRYPTLDEITSNYLAVSATNEIGFTLRYCYLFNDIERPNCEVERHCFARYFQRNDSHLVDTTAINTYKFPDFPNMFEQSNGRSWFLQALVKMNLHVHEVGQVKNILVLEANRYRTLECTTTVYSCGQRILETQELRYPSVDGASGRYLYQFDFVGRFFDAFMRSCMTLSQFGEARAALDNLSIQQVFRDVDDIRDKPDALCIMYTFMTGTGSIEITPVIPLAI